MSELIPNLGDLRAQLPPEDVASDAREFLEEVEKSQSMADVARNIDALLDRWLEVRDERNA